jgi:hypothetical protein
LKNVLKGIEDHNAPLIRKEAAKPALDLNAIRRKEREERERRTGVKDSERSHRRDRESSASTSNRDPEASQSNLRSNGKDISVKGPGFAARSFAIGLSGALGSRRDNDKKDTEIKAAIEDARHRASASEASDRRKGKGRAIDDAEEEEEYERSDRHGDGRRSASRSEEAESRGSERSSRSRRDAKASSHTSRRRYSRSRSPASDEERSSRSRRRREASYDDDYNRKKESRHRETDEEAPRRKERSHERRRSYKDSKHASRSSDNRQKRRRSTSAASDSGGESSASAASSDTFVDVSDLPSTAAGSSKMDKYFSTSYNPALDVSFSDLTDANTGLIAEGNFSEWDKMLAVLKKRKEDKVFGVSRAREEERENQLRKLEKKKRHEEREAKRALKKEKKRKKKRKRDSDDNEASESSGESVGPKERKKSPIRQTVVIDGFEYGKKGSTRAWDLGKDSML